MTKKTKIQKIKSTIKIAIVIFVLFVFVALGFFVKTTRTFENSSMKKWGLISDTERISTLQRVISDFDNQDLIIECVTKIAGLPDSESMIIRDAISLCYNGIKLNAQNTQSSDEK